MENTTTVQGVMPSVEVSLCRECPGHALSHEVCSYSAFLKQLRREIRKSRSNMKSIVLSYLGPVTVSNLGGGTIKKSRSKSYKAKQITRWQSLEEVNHGRYLHGR